MIKVGIIGATGYAGAEIVRLIQGHPEAEVVWYGSRSYVDEMYSSIYGNFFKIVDAKYKQFSTIYSEYLIYKTPYVNTDLCITFDQFAKMKYGIENISTGFSK